MQSSFKMPHRCKKLLFCPCSWPQGGNVKTILWWTLHVFLWTPQWLTWQCQVKKRLFKIEKKSICSLITKKKSMTNHNKHAQLNQAYFAHASTFTLKMFGGKHHWVNLPAPWSSFNTILSKIHGACACQQSPPQRWPGVMWWRQARKLWLLSSNEACPGKSGPSLHVVVIFVCGSPAVEMPKRSQQKVIHSSLAEKKWLDGHEIWSQIHQKEKELNGSMGTEEKPLKAWNPLWAA